MTSWLPDISDRKGAKYLRIADAIDDAIKQGDLLADTKLPPMRNLAYDLGVTLGTVSRAYQEAERRGLVGGHTGLLHRGCPIDSRRAARESVQRG